MEKIIGSGFEAAVASLALADGIAYRAARKNMQIHSAILLKVDGEFAGFFTFQNNHDVKEFCLLQSTILPQFLSKELYAEMVSRVLGQNTAGYPAFITTDPKSKFETAECFEGFGFKTYLEMSGFAYMVKGTDEDARFKLLAHVTMCNVWNSISGRWLKLKREWNERIEAAGAKHGIKNPKFASRDGCWQGSSGMSNVVFTKHTVEDGEIKTNSEKSHNGNASVLDPVACEVVLRFFMPSAGRRVYNPFGGGVQFGFVAGSYGYEYEASEIRKNQCDANNAICQDLKSPACWTQSDSISRMATLTKPHKSPKGERLVARISPDDKAIITLAAALAGQSVGSFVLAQARKAALDTLETRERIVLDAAQSRRFVEALLAPPRPPSPALLAAAQAYRTTVKSDLG